jgi:hypothetical protein
MRSYTGATEDAASGRAARPGGTAILRQALLLGGRLFLGQSASMRTGALLLLVAAAPTGQPGFA